MSNLWDYIKAVPFFEHYLPHIPNARRKTVGKNTRGNPLDFSNEEKKQINEALLKLFKEHLLQ